MNVSYVSFHVDPEDRPPSAELDSRSSLTETVSATAAAGCRISVVQAARRTERIERDGVTYHFQRVRPGPFGSAPRGARWLGGFRDLFEVLERTRPDVIHVQGLASAFHVGVLTRRFRNVPILAQDHASQAPRGARRWLDRWGFAKLSAVVFTSREQAVPFVEAGVLPRSIRVFEVIEGSSTFTPGDVGESRSRCGLFGDPCLLWVGRLDANKDLLTVFDALERVIERLPDTRLWCVFSEAPLLSEIEGRLNRNPGLSEHIRLVGRVPHVEMQHYYRAADIYTASSHREGSGFALLEALACGTTPVVTGIPSFRKITGGGQIGEIFAVGDSAGLAEGITNVARRDRTHARQQARHYFEQALSYDAIARQWLDAYDSLVGPA